jgi:hypothetical protein
MKCMNAGMHEMDDSPLQRYPQSISMDILKEFQMTKVEVLPVIGFLAAL